VIGFGCLSRIVMPPYVPSAKRRFQPISVPKHLHQVSPNGVITTRDQMLKLLALQPPTWFHECAGVFIIKAMCLACRRCVEAEHVFVRPHMQLRALTHDEWSEQTCPHNHLYKCIHFGHCGECYCDTWCSSECESESSSSD